MKCSICGEPMPPGEEMFKFHGLTGPCPKPPLPTPPEARDERDEVLYRVGRLLNDAFGTNLAQNPFDWRRLPDNIEWLIEAMRAKQEQAERPTPPAERYQTHDDISGHTCYRWESSTPPPDAVTRPVLAKQTDDGWMVVRQRETDPPEVWKFAGEGEARTFHDRAQQQWSDCYLVRIVKQGAQLDAPDSRVPN